MFLAVVDGSNPLDAAAMVEAVSLAVVGLESPDSEKTDRLVLKVR